ncbi:4-hydroxythreonine-4-phosphate dehydrogenase PdxA [candidate division WOR-3 bacterium]|nr:4-hydroxythreonine-4-phosphate dehydrogenase PdxA [candidate division WOR-3 bacterium]
MIGITIGDPAGIGPEVVLKAMAKLDARKFILIGPSSIICREKERLRLSNIPDIVDVEDEINIHIGKPSKESGETAYRTIIQSIQLLKEKKVSSLVTAPVSKEAINMAGHKFSGHTEMLATAFDIKRYTMFFYSNKMKVALVTRHIALSKVSKVLSIEKILNTIEQTHEFLSKNWKVLKGREQPNIGVIGLNPHAGESGNIGDEEIRYILPAIDIARKNGIQVEGPLVPDTAFRRNFDAFIAMYHDQALIPLKLLCFKSAVNITLGLPFIRTSPPHGTAFDIAGKDIADSGGMKEAIRMAIVLESHHKGNRRKA